MAEPRPPELLLASASPFRRRMLEAAGLTLRIVPPQVDEEALRQRMGVEDMAPAHVAEALARAKAEAVSARYPQALVIGADQVLALGTEIMSKPGDVAEARAQLKRLRGRAHNLCTAAALAVGGGNVWGHVDTATLLMRRFSDAFLDRYLAQMGTGVCQMVGAYQIEARGIQLFERVDGDYFSIIGLPLLPLLAELRARGVMAS